MRIVYTILIMTAISCNVWLHSWHNGFDTGYKAAMADALLGIKNPKDYFNEIIGRSVLPK